MASVSSYEVMEERLDTVEKLLAQHETALSKILSRLGGDEASWPPLMLAGTARAASPDAEGNDAIVEMGGQPLSPSDALETRIAELEQRVFEEDPSPTDNPKIEGMSHVTSVVDKAKAQERLEDYQYELQQTVWDALVFLFMDVLPLSDELLVIILGLGNLFIQLVFVVLVQVNMSEGDFSDGMMTLQLQDWRVNYAHDPGYANTFTNTPLAQAVCTRDPLNMEGSQQAILFKDIDDYLAAIYGLESGAVLCMLSVTLWLFTCLREMYRCFNYICAVWVKVWDCGSPELKGLKRLLSARSRAEYLKPKIMLIEAQLSKKTVQINISFLRGILLSCLVFIPRTVVLGWLGFVGVKFLIATIELDELILNAVALEVVLHVDEMIYELLMPIVGKQFVHKTFPMRIPQYNRTAKLLNPYVKLVAISGLIVFIRFLLLDPVLTNLKDARSMMCDGSVDFLAVPLAVGPVVAGMPREGGSINRTSYEYEAILQRTGLGKFVTPTLYFDADEDPTPFPLTNVWQATQFKNRGIKEIAGASPSDIAPAPWCTGDVEWELLFPYTSDAIWKAIQEVTQDLHANSCADLNSRGWCESGSTGGRISRFWCPDTCGLNDPQSGGIYGAAIQGVPMRCSGDMGEAMAGILCQDAEKSDPGFETYLQGVLGLFELQLSTMAGDNMTHWNFQKDDILGGIARMGCPWFSNENMPNNFLTDLQNGASYPMGIMLCNPSIIRPLFPGIRSARFLCPVTCGCLGEAQTYATDGKSWNPQIGAETDCFASCFNYSL